GAGTSVRWTHSWSIILRRSCGRNLRAKNIGDPSSVPCILRQSVRRLRGSCSLASLHQLQRLSVQLAPNLTTCCTESKVFLAKSRNVGFGESFRPRFACQEPLVCRHHRTMCLVQTDPPFPVRKNSSRKSKCRELVEWPVCGTRRKQGSKSKAEACKRPRLPA